MNAVEKKYTGTCKVEKYVNAVDASTKITKATIHTLYTDQACRLVIESAPGVDSSSKAPAVTYSATLLCSPSLIIPPGSHITVTQDGRTNVFKASGMPAVYPTHQEITLETDEEWA